MSELSRRLRGLPEHVIGIAVSLIVWCGLWGGPTLLNVVGGVAVVLLLELIFPMPAIGRELTVRPVAAVMFLARFFFDMFRSGLEVAWAAIRPRPVPDCSVVGVQLRSRSDLFLTFTAMLATLIPGSVVVEAQRSSGTVFLHAFDVTTPEEVEEFRQSILDQEERALRAFARREVLEGAGFSVRKGGRDA
ncbi:Na+/H+ antiporter subunit E [Helcobacillus massiliensis]|uniref:Multicomponent Na+:H+ antiporter subunit E n=1 Tax=Helcobacillus massiliensis TaxID=521392 RepID=A0A839QWU4_9MICO|nr:Na+/H+ antiporter subunit E [Helcobacillus massiliensis]MBB3023270.1 multicomponent Na+:H+ antiporter subunit E [Helcobacillus massiliensis]